ncbi:S8 family serine peptidase [Luteibacter sp. 329MFSha]|uniref:S8 family serine peptidase n=1 Tax=Luteibacter sp. 329MFSha TaxID=1798239 RepID=UPI0008CA0F85|nr:S8 family serine peptidase [Luteibacter sp. 329MFSha]SEW20612.1 serine protease [Luteibacter sp. 329MFSha]
MTLPAVLPRRALVAACILLAAPAFAGTAATAPLRPGSLTDRFIVTYKSPVPAGAAANTVDAAVAKTVAGNARVAAPVPRFVRRLAAGGELVKLSRKLGAADAATLMRQIAADPNVLSVRPDVRRHATGGTPVRRAAVAAPNDPSYAAYQWDYFDPTGGVRAPEAWQVSTGLGVVVAVLDTGIVAHPDIDLSLAGDGYDFISDAFVSGRASDGRAPGGWDTGDWTSTEPYTSECGTSEDSSWHGTHVAGTIAESTDNGVGLAGLAHDATVLPVRVLGHCGGYDSDIADAVVWAAGGHVDGVPDNTHPAQVINMSLGGYGACSDSPLGDAIAIALARGVSVVVAAGNDTDDAQNYAPASCPGVITVGATGITGKASYYSNFGKVVTVAAPGGGVFQDDDPASGQLVDQGFVWSLSNFGATTPTTPAYGGLAGTSQATPHVAAAVAMVQSGLVASGLDPLTPASLKKLVAASARPFPVTQPHPLGTGILDIDAALRLAGAGQAPDPSTTPLVNGRTASGIAATAGSAPVFRLTIPYGSTNASLRTLGGSGTVRLYVKRGAVPAADGSDADIVASRAGTAQVAVLPADAAGIYYARLVGAPSFTNVSLLGAFVAAKP